MLVPLMISLGALCAACFVSIIILAMGKIREAVRETHEQIESADCIIVLCHFLLSDGSLAPEFKERLYACVRIYNKRRRPIIMHGGHTAGVSRSQFDAAEEYLREMGVSDRHIYGGVAGADTLDEIRLAKELMERKRWSQPILLSNRLQLAQTKMLFPSFSMFSPIYVETKLRETTIGYRLTRYAVLVVTYFDPEGRNPVFRFVRWSRTSWLGSKL